jgi:hypothetical protein
LGGFGRRGCSRSIGGSDASTWRSSPFPIEAEQARGGRRTFDTVPVDVGFLKGIIPLTPALVTKGHPLGWSAASEWATTVSLLADYAKLKPVPSLGSLYTNQFAPNS